MIKFINTICMGENFERKSRADIKREDQYAEGVLENPVELEVAWESKTKEEKKALSIVKAIQDGGGDAYFVGGYVRDLAMSFNKAVYRKFRFNPHDIDIATNLAYEEVKKILQEHGYDRFKETGGNFTVLNVIVEIDGRHTEFEVASFRTEGDYGKDRRPREVSHTSDMREDVARRDFTIGGLYFDPVNRKIIDYVGGLRDIDERVLRAIGDPYERLVAEDPLRMMRYVRFLAKYNMKFDKEIRSVIQANAKVLHNLPAERLKGDDGELDKMLQSPRAAFALINMARVGILQEVLPEVYELLGVRHTPYGKKAAIHKEGDVFRHELESMRVIDTHPFLAVAREKLGISEEASDDETLELFYKKYGSEWAWAVLLHDIGKKQAREAVEEEGEVSGYRFYGHEKFSAELAQKIFSRLRFSNKEREEVGFLVANHMKAHGIAGTQGSELGKSARNELFRSAYAEELLFLNLADDLGNFSDGRSAKAKVDKFNRAWAMLEEFRKSEGDRAKSLRRNKELTRQILDVFIPKEMQGKQHGFPVIGVVKEVAQFMLDEERIPREEMTPFLEQMRDFLKEEGINYLKIPKDKIEDFKKTIRNALRRRYDVEI